MDNSSILSPKHYTSNKSGVEAIQIISHIPACRSNALKYLIRREYKTDEMEDLKKAIQYLNFEMHRLLFPIDDRDIDVLADKLMKAEGNSNIRKAMELIYHAESVGNDVISNLNTSQCLIHNEVSRLMLGGK